jgi:hypothetical protein
MVRGRVAQRGRQHPSKKVGKTALDFQGQTAQEGAEDEMGRIDEEHMTDPGPRGIQARLQLALEKSRLDLDVLCQVFLGGTGIIRTR